MKILKKMLRIGGIQKKKMALVISPPGSREERQQEWGTDRRTDSHRPMAAALHTIVKLPAKE